MQDTAPVCPVATHEGHPWLVTRYADVRAALADPRFSADLRRDGYPVLAPGQREAVASMPPTMAGMDAPEHTVIRRRIQEEFGTRRVRAMEPDIQRIVDAAFDAIENARGGPVDLVKALALPVPSAVICMLLGIPYADHDWFNDRTTAAFRRETSAADRVGVFTELMSYLDRLVRDKEADPPDDLLGRQIRLLREAGEYDHDELVSLANLLLIAGHETTAGMITVSVARLLTDDELRHELARDPARIPEAIEEFLRYFTIAQQALLRVANEDVVVGGVTIRKGEGVVLSVQAANRDPRAFSEPDELRIGQGRGHLAFGHGAHQCVGAKLARTELRIVLETLLRRRPDFRPAAPIEHLSCKESINVCGLEELPVVW
ncbi:cytochrome P450 [Streptomyces sparsogenes]|uniref:cytochrome P450 n=1 Tax=Streptomyces sparsogenes TaxID=67365 RepID=UPI001B8092AB|nr:cytochrome P450 [Streptomyces sparsogenes]